MLIDSHAHLTHESLKDDIGPQLVRAKNAGIDAIVNICTHPSEAAFGIELSKEYPWVYNAAATTPHDAEKEGNECFDAMARFALDGHLVAVGETGLDYHYFPDSKEVQKSLLKRYLELALQCSLPVVIHCREAFSDFFEIIDSYPQIRGVLHCFTGTIQEAKQLIDRGWYISFSGIVTFKKSLDLQEVAKIVPLSQLLIETDSPYLAPAPYRGKRNEPAYLVATAKFVADLRGITFEDLCLATSQNACSLFKF